MSKASLDIFYCFLVCAEVIINVCNSVLSVLLPDDVPI